MKSCAVEGCDRKYRCSGYCGLHYDRIRRRGVTDDPPRPASQQPCEVGACDRTQAARGWCTIHYYRWLNRGSIEWERKGTQSYSGVHLRIKRERGPASEYPCIDCGNPANEWSYDKTDPCPLIRAENAAPFSLDITRYDPRCRSCHRLHDRQKVAA